MGESLREIPEHIVSDITPESPHLHYGKDHTPSRGDLKHIQDLLPDPPAVHIQALKAKGISQKAKPQQMGVHTAHLREYGTQILGPVSDLQIHDMLHGIHISKSMPHGAYSADTLRDIYHLLKILFVN